MGTAESGMSVIVPGSASFRLLVTERVSAR
jgi:hypothetical protein